jgi:hypothetical protein
MELLKVTDKATLMDICKYSRAGECLNEEHMTSSNVYLMYYKHNTEGQHRQKNGPTKSTTSLYYVSRLADLNPMADKLNVTHSYIYTRLSLLVKPTSTPSGPSHQKIYHHKLKETDSATAKFSSSQYRTTMTPRKIYIAPTTIVSPTTCGSTLAFPQYDEHIPGWGHLHATTRTQDTLDHCANHTF